MNFFLEISEKKTKKSEFKRIINSKIRKKIKKPIKTNNEKNSSKKKNTIT
jgi:DNA-binding cell septation regulator SpoVG